MPTINIHARLSLVALLGGGRRVVRLQRNQHCPTPKTHPPLAAPCLQGRLSRPRGLHRRGRTRGPPGYLPLSYSHESLDEGRPTRPGFPTVKQGGAARPGNIRRLLCVEWLVRYPACTTDCFCIAVCRRDTQAQVEFEPPFVTGIIMWYCAIRL